MLVFCENAQTLHTSLPRGKRRPRCRASSKLYAAGGDNSYGRPLDSVEAYDPQQNHWEAVPNMGSVHDLGPAVAM